MLSENIIPLGKKLSPLKYRKTFQINSPLRPNRIKLSLRSHKRKNQSLKREISGNEKLNEKYIPLLRSLGMLFDNLLTAESGESAEVRSKRKRVRYYTNTGEFLCPCSSKSVTRNHSEEAAINSAEALPIEDPPPAKTTTEKPYTLTTSYIRSFRQNKNIPLLLPRNPLGRRRNYNGFSARSRAAYHGSSEGDFSRDNGNREPSARDRKHGSDAANDEENTSGDTRYSASGIESGGRIRSRHTSHATRDRAPNTEETTTKADESEVTLDFPRRNINKYKRKDKQQVRNNETESSEFLSTPIGRLRGIKPENQIDASDPELESENITQIYPHDQRVTERGSAFTEENQETSTRYETVNHNNIPTISPETSNTGGPLVFIIDGYSVTRNKHGENKLKEKAIHIKSK